MYLTVMVLTNIKSVMLIIIKIMYTYEYQLMLEHSNDYKHTQQHYNIICTQAIHSLDLYIITNYCTLLLMN